MRIHYREQGRCRVIELKATRSRLVKHRHRRLIFVALVLGTVIMVVISPMTGYPYDFSALTGEAQSWFLWGVPLLTQWKFGLDYTALNILDYCLRSVLMHAGISGAAAMHFAFKLPLIVATVGSAGSVYYLSDGEKNRGWTLFLFWILSPVSIWVAAVHGQIEPLAVFSTLLGLVLLRQGKWLWAGVIVGFGTGVEFFPLAVGFVALVEGHRRWSKFFQFVMGVGGSLGLCFGPSFFSPVGRAALLGGMASSAGVTMGRGSDWSIWHLLWKLNWGGMYSLQSHWYAFVLVLVIIAAFYCFKHTEHSIAALGAIFLATIIMDPNSMPQFTLIAQMAFFLMALNSPVNFVGILTSTMAGLMGYIFYPSVNVFFLDVDPTLGHLWQFWTSRHLAHWCADTFVIYSAVFLIYRTSKKWIKWPRFGRGTTWALIASTAISLLIAFWATQPALWAGVFASGPRQLFDFKSLTVNRGVPWSHDGAVLRIHTPTGLTDAIEAPRFFNVEFTVKPLAVEPKRRLMHSRLYQVYFPRDPSQREAVSSIRLQLLLGNSRWKSAIASGKKAYIVVGNRKVYPMSEIWTSPGWGLVSYRIPTSEFSRDLLYFRVSKKNIIDPTSKFVLYPYTGKFSGALSGQHVSGWYHVGIHTVGEVRLPLPSSQLQNFTLESRLFTQSIKITSVSIHFPAKHVRRNGTTIALVGGGVFRWFGVNNHLAVT